MKKNLLLYILLVFLIAVNGFFLFNYLGHSKGEENKRGPKGPGGFIAKELHFSEAQMIQFKELGEIHHQNMIANSEAAKKLKDELFKHVDDETVSEEVIDSILGKIAENEIKREKLTFYHLRDIQDICNEKQKKRFKRILNDALHRAARGGRPDGRRPGPPPHPMH